MASRACLQRMVSSRRNRVMRISRTGEAYRLSRAETRHPRRLPDCIPVVRVTCETVTVVLGYQHTQIVTTECQPPKQLNPGLALRNIAVRIVSAHGNSTTQPYEGPRHGAVGLLLA